MSQEFGRIADVIEVENKNRRFGSADKYLAVRVEHQGEETVILLTEHEFEIAQDRAYRNPEDCPKADGIVDWLRDLVD